MASKWSDVASEEGAYLKAVWNSQYPILAASTTYKVEFFGSLGEKSDRVLQKDGATSGLLSWHPSKKILATGWSNGAIVIWNEAENALRDAISHDSQPSTLTWSPNGHRLVSSDAVSLALF